MRIVVTGATCVGPGRLSLPAGAFALGPCLARGGDRPETAATVGVPVQRYVAVDLRPRLGAGGPRRRAAAFAVSDEPVLGRLLTIKGFAVAIVGGLGSVSGAMIAAVLLGMVEAIASGYISPAWSNAYAFGAMILVLLLRPSGLRGGMSDEPRQRSNPAAPFGGPAGRFAVAARLCSWRWFPRQPSATSCCRPSRSRSCSLSRHRPRACSTAKAGRCRSPTARSIGVGAYVAAIGAREQVLTIWLALAAAAAVAAVAAFLVGLDRVAGARTLLPDHHVCVRRAVADLDGQPAQPYRREPGRDGAGPVHVARDRRDRVAAAFFYLARRRSLCGLLSCCCGSAIWACAARGARERAARGLARPQRAARCGSIAFAVSGALAGFGGVLYVYHSSTSARTCSAPLPASRSSWSF